MSDDADFDDAVAKAARTKAEARRKRILEQSGQRLGIVSGEAPRVEPAADAPEEEANPEAASSGLSRMEAMRRRRFKKTPAIVPKEEKAEKEPPPGESPTPTLEKDSNADPETIDVPAEHETTLDETAKRPETIAAKASEAHAEGTEIKYLGVAKMRRQMLKDKKNALHSASASATLTKKGLATLKSPVHRLPIFLQLFTVILLFAAGLDVGWNQGLDDDVTIHRYLAPRTLSVSRIYRNADSSKPDPTLLLDQDDQWAQVHLDDEFTAKEEDEYVPNIDPLFQVDLDLLTKGDSIFLMLARGAIVIHRALLSLFYLLPLGLLKAALGIPKRLIATPPILCLISLVVRQGAKHALGAKLPDLDDGKEPKDILAMLQQTVMSFVTSSFPTAVALYDAFSNLRSDMYIILCGVFVGLAFTHHLGEGVSHESYTSGDEL